VLQETTGKFNTMSVTLRYLAREIGPNTPLAMFILQKNSYSDLQGFVRFSSDEGKTFGPMIQFTSQPGYHTMNNDRVTVLSSGRILCPVAWSPDIRKVNHLISWCYLSDDGGKTWRSGKQRIDLPKRGALEPETIELSDGRVKMIMRTTLGYIATAISSDGGDTWDTPSRLPVQAPDAPATIRRIPSTGHLLLIWNNNYAPNTDHVGKRNPLTAAISRDEGKTWKFVKNLESTKGETYAYTSVMFDGPRVVMSYYVENGKTKRYSQRFRSMPLSWFYEVSPAATSSK